MKTKTYPIVCKSCGGSGMMTNPNFDANLTDNLMSINCIACNGTGVIIMTETTIDDIPTFLTSKADK